MDAWETLISTSSLTPASSYDAWEHLNTQEGGGGSCTTILVDEYLLTMEDDMPDLVIEDGEFELELDDTGLEVTVDDTDYYIEVCNE
jgi:hypothetical protein